MLHLPPSNSFRGALSVFLLCALGGLAWWATQRAGGGEGDRVAAARAHVAASLRELCRTAGLPYPPAAIHLRAFKSEAQLEVWAQAKRQPFRLLATLPITRSSGRPGPKRREGDRQVPEGFYAIDQFNPNSKFHLSMRVNYPNASDRILSDREKPGGDIYLHGSDVSIGCLPLGDANIERLFILALDTQNGGQRDIPVHIFPARMSGEAWEAFRAQQIESDATLAPFWQSLQAGYDAFEQTHLVPKMAVGADGRYRLEP